MDDFRAVRYEKDQISGLLHPLIEVNAAISFSLINLAPEPFGPSEVNARVTSPFAPRFFGESSSIHRVALREYPAHPGATMHLIDPSAFQCGFENDEIALSENLADIMQFHPKAQIWFICTKSFH